MRYSNFRLVKDVVQAGVTPQNHWRKPDFLFAEVTEHFGPFNLLRRCITIAKEGGEPWYNIYSGKFISDKAGHLDAMQRAFAAQSLFC